MKSHSHQASFFFSLAYFVVISVEAGPSLIISEAVYTTTRFAKTAVILFWIGLLFTQGRRSHSTKTQNY